MEAALELLDPKGCVANRSLRVPRRLAAPQRPRPEERVERALTRAEGGIRGADVLPKAKLTAGDEDSPQLTKRGGRIGDAAENAHENRGVERPGLRRQRLGDAIDDLDWYRRRLCPLSGGSPRRRIRLDGQHLLDVRRVELERAPVAGADLDYPPTQSGERFPTELARGQIGATQLSLLEIPREARLLRAVEGRFGEPQ